MKIHAYARTIGLMLLVLALTSGDFAALGAEADSVASADDAAVSPSPDTKDASKSSTASKDESDEKKKKKGTPVSAYYKKGLRIETEDNSFAARIRWRVQMRATDLTSSDLAGQQDGIDEESGFRIRRARFKLDGHVYKPWLEYYLEYGIAASVMLTWQFDINYNEKASVRVGQYKVVYNRERVDSSGKLQFVDRSIVNNPFTVDRQQGVHLSGRLFKESAADSHYWIGVFTGTGRGGGLEADGSPMYVGRWQWNFLKRELPFSESDVKITPETTASLAVAAAENRGAFTLWSSAGPGELPGLPVGAPSQYRTRQWMGEFALMRRGLSVQGEYHDKKVDDTINNVNYELDGYYAQVGYFFHQVADAFPEKLELAIRHARINSVQGITVPADRESTVAANYFFDHHENKLTADVSYLQSTLFGGSEDTGWRVRLQWDITF